MLSEGQWEEEGSGAERGRSGQNCVDWYEVYINVRCMHSKVSQFIYVQQQDMLETHSTSSLSWLVQQLNELLIEIQIKPNTEDSLCDNVVECNLCITSSLL